MLLGKELNIIEYFPYVALPGMAEDGRGWLRIARVGRGWPGMAGDVLGWPGIARDGRGLN